jgi:plastocyanin
VDVTLSATDPAEQGTGGGGTPSTVDITATPSTWTPAAASAKVGDTVRWNFPASAQVPHDLWAIKPGESPLSDGTLQITGSLPLVIPPAAPVNTVVDQAGTWTFVCKIHGHKGATEWEGMVAKVTVSSGSTTVPGSGVDYTEYRVNGGEWTKKTNTGNASPFVSTFKAEAEGDYAIDYRSADKNGNVEATKSVSFKITKPTQPDDSVTAEGDVVAPIGRVLGITLGGTIDLGALQPGVAKDYDASTTVLATSSLPASKLTVHDNSTTATGHLVNGTFPLPQALKVAAGTGAFGALGGAAAPTLLASWAHPLANDAVELKFRQSVAATDRLLVGNYGKRVTLTLSATTP